MTTGMDQLGRTLSTAMDEGTPLYLLGEALELSPVTTGLAARFPDRVHLLPCSDAALVGVAVGLALAGKRAVVELASSSAATALAQLAEAVSFTQRSEFRAPLIVRVPLDPGHGDGWQLLEGLAGLQVAAVGRASDAAALLIEALSSDRPTVLLEPRAVLAQRLEAPGRTGLGHAHLVREGDHATLAAWGEGVGAAIAAADLLSRDGLSVDVLDLRWLGPVDRQLLSERVAHTGRLVVVGTGSAGLLAALDEPFWRLESPPRRAGPSAAAIVTAARDALADG